MHTKKRRKIISAVISQSKEIQRTSSHPFVVFVEKILYPYTEGTTEWGDDGYYRNITLEFGFPFFGKRYKNIQVRRQQN